MSEANRTPQTTSENKNHAKKKEKCYDIVHVSDILREPIVSLSGVVDRIASVAAMMFSSIQRSSYSSSSSWKSSFLPSSTKVSLHPLEKGHPWYCENHTIRIFNSQTYLYTLLLCHLPHLTKCSTYSNHTIPSTPKTVTAAE